LRATSTSQLNEDSKILHNSQVFKQQEKEKPPGDMENCTERHCGADTNVSLTNDSVAMPSVESLKLGLEVLIALFGVVGNVLVTAVICRMGKKKKPVDLYLLNLAIADLGFLLLTFPLGVIKEKLPFNWPQGEFACLYLQPMPELFHGFSVWCITIIALHRIDI